MTVASAARAESPKSQPPPARAPETGGDDGLRFTFGLGAAAKDISRQPRFAVPLEATLVPRAYFNTSAGIVVSSLGLDEAYGELGFWLLVDVGLGIGYGQRQTSHGVEWAPIGHLFTGVPIRLDGDPFNFGKKWFAYALPYYRPSWDLRTKGVSHEVGLMIKMSYMLRPMQLGLTDL